jgi:hypothetical protein
MQDKGQQETFKMYGSLGLKVYHKNQSVFNYGDDGDLFYIVIKGSVGVKAPTEIHIECSNYFEIL